MHFNNFIDKGRSVKSSTEKESNSSMKLKMQEHQNFEKNVVDFKFLLHSLNHRTYDSYHKDGFLIIMNLAITNNARTTIANHPLSSLQKGHKNLVKELETKLLDSYEMTLNKYIYIYKEHG